MSLRLRTSFHQTEVRTVSDMRLGWLADVEIDELKGAVCAIGAESIPRLPVSLHWIPVEHIVSWSEECIRVDDATVSYLERQRVTPAAKALPLTASVYGES